MFSALGTDMLVRAQLDEVARLAERGAHAHRFFSLRKPGPKTPAVTRPVAFRQSWEDPALIKLQLAGEASSFPR